MSGKTKYGEPDFGRRLSASDVVVVIPFRNHSIAALVVIVPLLAGPGLGDHTPNFTLVCPATPDSGITFEPPLTGVVGTGYANLTLAPGDCGFAFAGRGCDGSARTCAGTEVGPTEGLQIEEWRYQGDCVRAVFFKVPTQDADDEFELYGSTLAQFRRADPPDSHTQVLTIALRPDEVCNTRWAEATSMVYIANRD